MQLKINRLQHVGIPIVNIDISRAFYERLGFQDVMHSTFVHEGSAGKVSMMKREEIVLELYHMPEPVLTLVKQRSVLAAIRGILSWSSPVLMLN